MRVRLGPQSKFNHPIMGLLDGLTLDAAELTNEWYFDVMMQIVYKAKSSLLPGETILASPKTEKEVKDDFENYISQMLQSSRKWDMRKFVADKFYEIEGNKCKGVVMQENNAFSVTFYPENGEPAKAAKPKWKFW